MREWTMRDGLAIFALKDLAEDDKLAASAEGLQALVWAISVLSGQDDEGLWDMPMSQFTILVKTTIEESAIRSKKANMEIGMGSLVQKVLDDIEPEEGNP